MGFQIMSEFEFQTFFWILYCNFPVFFIMTPPLRRVFQRAFQEALHGIYKKLFKKVTNLTFEKLLNWVVCELPVEVLL